MNRKEKGKRIKGDERILGDGDFVNQVLSEAKDKYARHYELKRLGYDFKKICERVCDIYGRGSSSDLTIGRQKIKVNERSLICFWSVNELKMSLTDLAKIFDQSPSTIGYAVERGRTIAKESNYRLIVETDNQKNTA